MKKPDKVFQITDQTDLDGTNNNRNEELFENKPSVEKGVLENPEANDEIQVIELSEEDIPEYCDLTRYLKKHSKKIVPYDYFEFKTTEIFQNLGCKLSDSILIRGYKGCGKTAMVEHIVNKINKKKCPAMFEDTKVIQVGAGIFSPDALAEGIVYTLTMILTQVKACGVKKVILFLDNFDEFPGSFATNFSYVKNTLKEIFDFEFFKIIMIMPNEFFSEANLCNLDFFVKSKVIDLNALIDFELAVKIIEPKVKEISKLHGNIKFSKDLILKSLLLSYSKSKIGSINLTEFIKVCDVVCSICTQRNSEKVEVCDIEAAFCNDYNANNKIPEKMRLSTAYHEAGHVLLVLVALPEEAELMGVNVVFDMDSGRSGCTFMAMKCLNLRLNKLETKKRVAFYLAGRRAEKILGSKPTLGALSDLNQARDIAKDFIYSSGTSKTLGKNCSYICEGETITMSDSMVEKVEKEYKLFIKKANKYCKKIITENEEFLHILANVLYEKGQMDKVEILKLWESYKKRLSKKNNK